MSDIDTLGDLIRDNYQLALYCENLSCRHWAWAGLTDLAALLGEHHGSLHDDLTPKLRCSVCGGKRASMRMHPPTPAMINNPRQETT